MLIFERERLARSFSHLKMKAPGIVMRGPDRREQETCMTSDVLASPANGATTTQTTEEPTASRRSRQNNKTTTTRPSVLPLLFHQVSISCCHSFAHL
jgi:hypothetical protein